MIDFENGAIIKLRPVDISTLADKVAPLLVAGEEVRQAYKAVRDSVVFTNKRIITINVQGVVGKKVDYTSLPYTRIQAFSVESAGLIDLESELELWFSGLGKVRLEFIVHADVSEICRMIGERIL